MNNSINQVADSILGLPPTSTLLYKNSWDFSLYVQRVVHGINVKLDFYIVDEAKRVFGPISFKPSQLQGKGGFNFLYDVPGRFDKSDEDSIKAEYRKVEKDLKEFSHDEKVPFEIVYEELTTAEEIEDIITRTDTPDSRYINIDVTTFKDLVSKADWGWTPIEVKRRLREAGLLRINRSRPFDFTLTDKDGSHYRTISIRLDMNPGYSGREVKA